MLRGTAPEYLQELIPRYVHARPLLSSSQPRLVIPSAAEKHTNKQFGFRAFSNSASKLWNALPQRVREADTAAFRKRLKTPPCVWCYPSLFQLCEWLCTMCLFLLLVYDFLSIHSPPPPPPRSFKLMETSYKARHHHHHQLKATKQSISLRQPRTTPCSHGSWDSLKWDGCVCVCVGGVHRLPITPTHPASWWWREGLHTSSPSESVIFSNRF